MGKQSARLYYQGEDCYDVYYERSNLSKMYMEGDMLWERLAPKFILCNSYGLYTSEKMRAISTFRGYFENSLQLKPTETFENSFINGIEYIDGYYYILYIFYTSEYRVNKYRRWLLKSENGYDWKKVLDFEEEKTTAYSMGKYQGKLVFEAESYIGQKFIGFFTLGFNLEREKIFNFYDIAIPKEIGNQKVSICGNTIFFEREGRHNNFEYDKPIQVVIKNGSYSEIKKPIDFSIITYEKSGYFYSISDSYMLVRSKDGISWENVAAAIKNGMVFPNILPYNGFFYSYDFRGSILRTKIGQSVEENVLLQDTDNNFSCFVIGEYFYILLSNELYKTKDPFSVRLGSNGLENAEKVKNSYPYYSGNFSHILCTDEGVEIFL